MLSGRGLEELCAYHPRLRSCITVSSMSLYNVLKHIVDVSFFEQLVVAYHHGYSFII